jgi:predicted transposase YbfD/YdcC
MQEFDDDLLFTLIDHFEIIEDPRLDRTKKHNVIDIISITVMATVSGMKNWIDIVDWGKANEEWLKTLLELPNGIPSHDTFGRVFSLIKPEPFQKAFKEWVESIDLNFHSRETIAIDGKILKGSIRKKPENIDKKSSLLMVTAWACKSGLSLGQLSSRMNKNEGEKKTMEKLIDQIDVRGNIITIDAAGATPNIITKISNKGGDCVIGLKENQPKARELAGKLFENKKAKNLIKNFSQIGKGHGRVEKRKYELLVLSSVNIVDLNPAIAKFNKKFPSILSFGRVVSEIKKGATTTIHERFFLTSLTNEKEFAESAREHWNVENTLHWQLDVTFREDDCRVRIGYAADNLGLVRRLALSLLKKETASKKSIRRKQNACNWDKNYLLQILKGI